MALIYVVEDDQNIREIERFALQNSGYHVEEFGNAKEFYKRIADKLPQLILLDIMLPDEDGLAIIKKLRSMSETKRVPVIMVTAKTTELDKVKGLDLGADDYLPKPYHLAELHARLKSLFRRNQREGEKKVSYGNVEVIPDHFKVAVGGKELDLNRKEYDILLYFMLRPGRLVNKTTLAESVWGDHIDQVDNFDFIYAQIKNLRKHLKEAGATVELKAVYGIGYKLVEE